jgi:hypothetical protein
MPLLRLLTACAALVLALAPAPPAAAQQRSPVVVELFTSQGCDSCPRANRLMGRLSHDPSVIVLTFPVDYWDYLGWRDTFARPEFSRRQRDYMRAFASRNLFTPQIILNGQLAHRGARLDRIRLTLSELQGGDGSAGPTVTLTESERGLRVAVGRALAAHPADVWVASFDPGPVYADIGAGENAGVRVPHYNLVRRIAKLGAWEGEAVSFERNVCRPACAVLVQERAGGRILAAAIFPAPDTP